MSNIQRIVTTSLLIAVGVILPYFTTHAFGVPGVVFLPMHIPVLLCGLLCGGWYGLACGILTPMLSSLLTGMPAPHILPVMTCELATYGAVSGYVQIKWNRNLVSLGVAMVAGRISYAIAFFVIAMLFGVPKMPGVVAAIGTGWIGIVIQLVVVPALFVAVTTRVYRVMPRAYNMVRSDDVNCVIVKDGKIAKTSMEPGIKGLMEVYETSPSLLKNAIVFDKIIGKASAVIIVLGGVSEAYGMVMSDAAMRFLRRHGVRFWCREYTDTIMNRSGNDTCPMEKLVAGCEEPSIAYKKLKDFIADRA